MTGRRRLPAALAAALALVTAVVVLRATAGAPAPPPPAPVAAPAVAAQSAPGVTVEEPARPGTPTDPEFVLGPDTPVLRWAPVPGAAGYEVQWQAPGRPARSLLTAAPAVALSGVAARSSVTVAVSAVDAVGRRSAPLRLASGSLEPDADPGPPPAFRDAFSSSTAPDRVRWRLPEDGPACLARGAGGERGTLVVPPGCGPVELRPAVPLQLGDPAADGTRGRLAVAADGPGEGGELVLALLPGPHAGLGADLLAATPPPAGTAVADPALPPGGVLLRIGPDGPALVLGAGAAPATTAGPAAPPGPGAPGVPRTWELRIAADRVEVLRDGAVALAAAAAVTWAEATAVLAVRPGAARVLLDGVRMTAGGPPRGSVRVLRVGGAVPPDAPVPAAELAGAEAVRLLGRFRPDPAGGTAEVRLGGAAAALRPADGAAPPVPDRAVAVVADLDPPPDGAAGTAPLALPGGGVLTDAVLEVTRRAGPPAVDVRLPFADTPPPPVGEPALRLLDGTGAELDPAAPLPPGPVVLEISVDPVQVGAGVAGVAGLQLDLGGRRLLGLPTDRDGPAPGGTTRVRLDAAVVAAGGALTARVVPADPSVAATSASLALPTS